MLKPTRDGERSWLVPLSAGTLIRAYVQPRASRTEVVGLHGSDGPDAPRLKIRIAAPPVDGEANAELLAFLKRRLGATGAVLELVRGQSSRSKDVLYKGALGLEELTVLLMPAARRER